jgi:hypothetical protein
MDYSCYVIIDNSKNNLNLNLTECVVGNGNFINLPQQIAAKSQATLWLQDEPGIHGSDAVVGYQADDGKSHDFTFDCPMGVCNNKCSGGSSFRAKSGDGGWLSPGKVPKKGHPLFVDFNV